MAKPRATKAKKTKKAAEEPIKAKRSVPPKAASIPPPKAASVPPPKTSSVPPPTSSAARWEERGEKDAYALDLLERLVRYYGGRASATSSDSMRAAAVVLSTLSLCLAASEDEQLIALATAAKDLRKHV